MKQTTEQIKILSNNKNIHTAKSLAEAMVQINKVPVDFIISDWELGDGEGIDFLKSVRQDPKFQKVPFIMITSKANATDMLKAIELGANGYLIKPWTNTELSDLIEEVRKKSM